MRVPFGRLALVAAVILCDLAACGSSNSQSPPDCPNDVPATCPDPAPTFTEIAPLIQTRCGACHAPGGVEAVRPFVTYDQVKLQQTDILFQLSLCLMPPANQVQPTSSERQAIFGWIKCGALDN